MTLLALTPGVPAVVRIPHRRFWCEAGSDQIYMDGRKITHDEAAALIEGWWFKARRFDREGRKWAADTCTEAADELQAALKQAQNWRGCQDRHPLAFVGAAALAASVAALFGE